MWPLQSHRCPHSGPWLPSCLQESGLHAPLTWALLQIIWALKHPHHNPLVCYETPWEFYHLIAKMMNYCKQNWRLRKPRKRLAFQWALIQGDWRDNLNLPGRLVGMAFEEDRFLLLLFSSSVVSNSLWLHGLQYARPPCPSPSPGVCSNSCSLNQWCHPTISSSVAPFPSTLQSFPASGYFPVSWLFALGSQSIRASASVLPMNSQGWFPLGLIDWFDLLAVQGTLKSLLQHQSLKARFF